MHLNILPTGIMSKKKPRQDSQDKEGTKALFGPEEDFLGGRLQDARVLERGPQKVRGYPARGRIARPLRISVGHTGIGSAMHFLDSFCCYVTCNRKGGALCRLLSVKE